VADEAVLPFCALHQPALLTVGYVVARRPIPDPAKWAIIALLSFAITLGLYGFLIRPVNLLRFLFGMKPRGDGPTA
jgi:glucan biosynthesis protein C